MPRTARLLTLAFVTTLCSTLTSVTARVLTDTSHSAASHEHTFQCGNTHVEADRQAEIEAPIQQALAQRQSQRLAATSQPTAEDDAALITVPVYWHVIYQAEDVADGYYPDSTIAAQIGVLNSVYNGVGFEFVLAGVDRTLNADWFQNLQSQTQEEADMTTALHKGNFTTLNFYTARMASLGGGSTLLGYSYNPWDVVPDFPTYDGVYVNDRTMPGGSAVSSSYTFNLGIVGVHEVGHWLGLYHTFNGNNCTGPGDMVTDTHAEYSAAFVCAPRSSCPMYPGTDPIRNYMDYTDDVCRNGFSAGQVQRMLDIWSLYRAPSAVPPAGTPTFFTGAPAPGPGSTSTTATATAPVLVLTPAPAPAPVTGTTADGRIIPKTASQPAPGKPTARPMSSRSSSSTQAAKSKPTPRPAAKPHTHPHPKPHLRPHPTAHPKPHPRPTPQPASKKKPPVHTIKSNAGLKRVILLRHSVMTSAKAMLDAILPMN